MSITRKALKFYTEHLEREVKSLRSECDAKTSNCKYFDKLFEEKNAEIDKLKAELANGKQLLADKTSEAAYLRDELRQRPSMAMTEERARKLIQRTSWIKIRDDNALVDHNGDLLCEPGSDRLEYRNGGDIDDEMEAIVWWYRNKCKGA